MFTTSKLAGTNICPQLTQSTETGSWTSVNKRRKNIRHLKKINNRSTVLVSESTVCSCRINNNTDVGFFRDVLPLWASPVTVPSPAGLPSWSRHFQSMPRTTRAPGTMYFITWERNRRRWRRRFASASFTALPEKRRMERERQVYLMWKHKGDFNTHKGTKHMDQNKTRDCEIMFRNDFKTCSCKLIGKKLYFLVVCEFVERFVVVAKF